MITNVWKLSTMVLAALLTLVLGFSLVSTAGAERQPHMKKALGTLRVAKSQLEAATPDKGGHRVKAIELTAAAIGEVEAGIAYDNAH